MYSSTSGTHLSVAMGLIKRLRCLFATFGVTKELRSDEDPEFTAECIDKFLRE